MLDMAMKFKSINQKESYYHEYRVYSQHVFCSMGGLLGHQILFSTGFNISIKQEICRIIFVDNVQ